jgi:hypothetical protein
VRYATREMKNGISLLRCQVQIIIGIFLNIQNKVKFYLFSTFHICLHEKIVHDDVLDSFMLSMIRSLEIWKASQRS